MKKSIKKEIDAYLAEQIPKLVRLECQRIALEKSIEDLKCAQLATCCAGLYNGISIESSPIGGKQFIR